MRAYHWLLAVALLFPMAAWPQSADISAVGTEAPSEVRAIISQCGSASIVDRADGWMRYYTRMDGKSLLMASLFEGLPRQATHMPSADGPVLGDKGWCGLCGCQEWQCEQEAIGKCRNLKCPLGDSCCVFWVSNDECRFDDPCFNEGRCICDVNVWCC